MSHGAPTPEGEAADAKVDAWGTEKAETKPEPEPEPKPEGGEPAAKTESEAGSMSAKSEDGVDLMDRSVTVRELHILFHTLGVKPRKPCPIEFYRNHFCVGRVDTFRRSADWPTIFELELKGLMAERQNFCQRYSVVTELGIRLVREIRGTEYAEAEDEVEDQGGEE